MKLLNLGPVKYDDTQIIYHAMAKAGKEALILISPTTPYVSVGYFQDARQEVDLDFCKNNNLPIIRREVGGGAVYLDGKQLFFQLIMHKDNPVIPVSREQFYKKFLEPIVNTYRRIGIDARYKPVNDVLVGNRKISGTGVGEIGDCVVFVGNLIIDFDFATMTKVLKVPDEKFRDKVFQTMSENMTTINRELGMDGAAKWSVQELNAIMAEEFGKILGDLEPESVEDGFGPDVEDLRKTLAPKMTSDEWLFQTARRFSHKDVKIREGANVVEKSFKAVGGLLRAVYEVIDGEFGQVQITGDFFCYPENAVALIERELSGKPVVQAKSIVSKLYQDKKLETPGIGVDDWMEVFQV